MTNSFSWKTKFKSIIIVDGELFSNEYSIKLFITPYTANLKEQTEYFDRLKNLFEMVFANTITFPDTKRFLYEFLTPDGGTTILMQQIGKIYT